MVTGATGGMGRVIVRELARRGGTVIAVARSRVEFEPKNVEVMTADLSSLAEVRRLAAEFTAKHDALHLLVNNAGAHFRHRAISADGVEMHIAVNHLGGFRLTNLLRPALRAGAPARVVNVVSAAMTDTRQVKIRRRPRPVSLEPAELPDLNGERGFEPFTAYARAKLLTLMAGYHLAETVDGVTVNAVNPGLAGTKIVDDMMPTFMRPFGGLVKRSLLTPEQSAAFILRVATSPDLDGVTGRYFDRDVEARSPEISYDRALREWVWNSSLEFSEAR